MTGLRVLVTAATGALGRTFCQELYHDQLRVDHVFAVGEKEELPYYFRTTTRTASRTGARTCSASAT
jgi:FlaA1/EpsC-like NDP-sugar epimerase